jgi:hypothetical protein
MPPKRQAFRQKSVDEGKKGVEGGLLQRKITINRPERRDEGELKKMGGMSKALSTESALELVGESQHHINETEILFHKHTETMKGLKLPGGLRVRPLTGLDHIITHAETDTLIAHELAGLPGRMELTRGTTVKYFGEKGRENFYKRMNWVHKQRQNAFTKKDQLDAPVDELFFDNELDTLEHASINYPFAPVRPDRLARSKVHEEFIKDKLGRIDSVAKSEEDFKHELEVCEEK